MKKRVVVRALYICILLVGTHTAVFGQLSFCAGRSGDVIFNEDFGAGTANGPALPVSITNYRYVNSGVQDGEYTISSNMGQLGSFWDIGDHTGDPDGRMLIVNADFNPGIFYQTPINGLCENTPYEFSAWIINVYNATTNICPNNGIPIQVRFEIWDSTDTVLLSSGNMAPRRGERSPSWIKYGLTFTSSPGQNGCILKLLNQGAGGCGNDLAIDDIQFRPCGDVTNISNGGETVTSVCRSDLPTTVSLSSNTTTTIFASAEFQWQSSTDGVFFNDIPGANSSTFNSPPITESTVFRVKIAEDAINLNNNQCVTFSDLFRLEAESVTDPVPAFNSIVSCDNEEVELAVSTVTGTEFDWYDAPIGGNLLLRNSSTFTTDTGGFYYVEARTVAASCLSSNRAEIEVIEANAPVIPLEEFFVCENENQVLRVDFAPATYLWSTGETTQSIEVSSAGSYTCEITTAQGCIGVAEFEVSTIAVPFISELDVAGDSLRVVLQNPNPIFVYSIDGVNFQDSPIFDLETQLEVTVFIKNSRGCDVIQESFFRIDINPSFTPNGDGFNDRWTIDGLSNFPGSRIEIFDRYGKLIEQLNQPEFEGWDGTFNGQQLPSSDYWFKLFYNEQIVTGHFSLKR